MLDMLLILEKRRKFQKSHSLEIRKLKIIPKISIIISEEYKFWKFISGKKYLNENLINFDKKLLNNFYKNNGFYNVNIESSFANYLGSDEFELIYNIFF